MSYQLINVTPRIFGWFVGLVLAIFLVANPVQAQSDNSYAPAEEYLIMNLSGDVPKRLPAFNLTVTMRPLDCQSSRCQSKWTINQSTRLVDASGKFNKLSGLFAHTDYAVEWIRTDGVQSRLITQLKLRKSK